MSAKMGRAPASTDKAAAKKMSAGTTTSSPGPKPTTSSSMMSASVPLNLGPGVDGHCLPIDPSYLS
jgi:hypothetical protein